MTISRYTSCLVMGAFLSVIPLWCFAIDSAVFRSVIPGVSLLETWRNEAGYPSELIEEPNHELIKHCASGKPVFIIEVPGKQFHCRHKIIDGFNQIEILSNDKALVGPITVSTKDLSSKKFKVEPLNIQEQDLINDVLIARRALLSKEEKGKSNELISAGVISEEQRREYLKEITNSTVYNKKRTTGSKILTEHNVLAIREVGISTSVLGWNFRYVVIDLSESRPKFIGEFEGCIDNFADIDQDGAPEVKTSWCENTEGSSYSYSRLLPTLKVLVNRTQ